MLDVRTAEAVEKSVATGNWKKSQISTFHTPETLSGLSMKLKPVD